MSDPYYGVWPQFNISAEDIAMAPEPEQKPECNMNEPYLIAHKVCGCAAFDIAIQMECPECIDKSDDFNCTECDNHWVWWIIPTSGHRAYPYWSIELDAIYYDHPLYDHIRLLGEKNVPPMPEVWPDHYAHGPAPKLDIKSLFKALPKPTIPRRL
jgi:hypothetical protein